MVCEKNVLAVLRVRGESMIRAGLGDNETRCQQRVRGNWNMPSFLRTRAAVVLWHGYLTSPTCVSGAPVFARPSAGHLGDQRI